MTDAGTPEKKVFAPLSDEEKQAIDDKVRAAAAAHGGITGLYQAARATFMVDDARSADTEPSPKAKLRAAEVALRALQGAYGQMIFEANWGAALALRPVIGEATERLGLVLDAHKGTQK